MLLGGGGASGWLRVRTSPADSSVATPMTDDTRVSRWSRAQRGRRAPPSWSLPRPTHGTLGPAYTALVCSICSNPHQKPRPGPPAPAPRPVPQVWRAPVLRQRRRSILVPTGLLSIRGHDPPAPAHPRLRPCPPCLRQLLPCARTPAHAGPGHVRPPGACCHARVDPAPLPGPSRRHSPSPDA